MIPRSRWFLLPTVITSFGLISSNLAVNTAAFAQSAVPPAPPGTAAPAVSTAGDPPARVGWLSNLSGSVSFHSANQNEWTTASQNYPFATGDAVWTQPQASASVMVDATRVALNGGTELTAQEIDQSTLTASLSQGEIFLNVVSLQNGQSVVVETPRGTVQITNNGQYEIYAGDSNTPTYVTTVTGSLQFTGLGQNAPQVVGAQQTLVVSGTNPVQSQLGGMQQDQFLTTMLQQITPPPPPTAVAAPAVTAQMTGAAVLSQYGTWQQQSGVGAVWYPQVASSWVPYREGRWAYIQPWGWTWVDNAPWGFAPFHYGRWAQYGGRWGWVPAPAVDPGYNYSTYQPVYAPALVTFLGAAAGVLTAAALGSGAIGWAPLAPRDPYYPPYAVSPNYFAAYNRPYVQNYNQFYQRNITVVNNRIDYRNVQVVNNYNGSGPGGFNRQGATFVPRDAMLQSSPIAAVAHPLPQGAQVQPFHPGDPQQLPRPTAGTWGVTPAMAAREHLSPAVNGTAPRPQAPGPAIHPMVVGQARQAPPALVPHAAVAPSFRGGAPAIAPRGVAVGQEAHVPPGAPQAAQANQPVHGPQAVPGQAPAGIASHGLPPLPQAAGHNEAARPNFQPAAPNAQAHGPGGGAPAPQPAAMAPVHGAQAPGPGNQQPRTEAAHTMPGLAHQAPPQAAAHGEAPRQAVPQAPRAQAPQPAVHAAAPPVEPRPAPTQHVEARPAPRVEAPRLAAQPAPHVEAPRPSPAPAAHVEAPRPAPAPHVEAPPPAPHEQAHGNVPRPQPQH